ncbi:hypothetical protein DAPPUDRAFT_307755 [Daphnia pulex]|uniref:Chitin-binding type-2 domain-containing protein n=1 Tax=Daphnia pulex TaxID=6669 RepID=E9G1N0_DAPPU|nr:hypothetical protein DAPPUDRAFT_307755 [Daphnia pulex]|eukprot:EFX86782.1 hypothetical protein DAPPUDRAFT_307755 [Daphnia pulex]
MRALALSVVLLAAVAHSCLAAVGDPRGHAGEPPVFDCTGKVGFFADLWKNCEVYYNCLEDGTKVMYGCPRENNGNQHQTYFNEAVVECVKDYQCPDPDPIKPVEN